MLHVRSGLFLLKLEKRHCIIGRNIKFTSNDQNTTGKRCLENKENSDIHKNKTKQNANARVWGLRFGHLRSTINVFYFFCTLSKNYEILPMKKKTIISFMRKLQQIYSGYRCYMHSVSFLQVTPYSFPTTYRC